MQRNLSRSQYGTGKRWKESCGLFTRRKIAFCVDDDNQRLSYERSRGYCTSWWEGAAQVFLLRARQWKEFKSSVVSELEKSCCLPEELVKPPTIRNLNVTYWDRTLVLVPHWVSSFDKRNVRNERGDQSRTAQLLLTLFFLRVLSFHWLLIYTIFFSFFFLFHNKQKRKFMEPQLESSSTLQ